MSIKRKEQLVVSAEKPVPPRDSLLWQQRSSAIRRLAKAREVDDDVNLVQPTVAGDD